MGKCILIAWPNATARGDEGWYKVLKRLGIFKNLNFRVGHAAIILVSAENGRLRYYDFGRYICPRGMGRVRSADSDPGLQLNSKWENLNASCPSNLQQILAEMEAKATYTHGKGPMYFSFCNAFDTEKAMTWCDQKVQEGAYPYGAFAPNNSNCSRFVWNTYEKGVARENRMGIPMIHETLMPSPISNVVNGGDLQLVYSYENGSLDKRRMSRFQSLQHFVNNLSLNMRSSGKEILPPDREPTIHQAPCPPNSVPPQAQWLGGIGEGAWYQIDREEDRILITRYTANGIKEYVQVFDEIPPPLLDAASIDICHNSHMGQAKLRANGKTFLLYPTEVHSCLGDAGE